MAVSQQEAIKELQRRGVDTGDAPQQDLLQKIVASAPVQAALGGSREAARQLAAALPPTLQALGTAAPIPFGAARAIGQRLPSRLPIPQPTTTAQRLGAGAQDIASFIGAGAAGGPAVEAARALPAIAAPVARLAGTATFGGLTDPNRARGLLTGTGAGAFGEAIPAVAKGIQKLSPQFLTDSIMGYLKGGRASLEDNTKSLAQDIKKSFKQKKEEASALYNPFFDKVGKNNIYEKQLAKTTKYPNLPEKVIDDLLPNTEDMHTEFINNPTVQNAHTLQSQLGFEIRNLDRPGLKPSEKRTLQNWDKTRKALKEDVNNFLIQKDSTGDLSNQYNNATAFFRDNVAPYKSNTAISKIAAGVVANPKNVSTIFKFPEEGVQKVAEDLGDEGKKKILFNELGKIKNITPQKLSDGIENLDKKGLSSYITPTLQEQIDKMPGRLQAAQALQRGAGLVGGIVAGGAGGLPAEALAGAGGAAISPFVLRQLAKLVPTRTIARAFPAIRRVATGAALGAPQPRQAATTPTITQQQALTELRRRGVS